jgi:hypothetical protein
MNARSQWTYFSTKESTMPNFKDQSMIAAVRRYAFDNYDNGWKVLADQWADGDILEVISDADATTPQQAIAACGRLLKLAAGGRR